MTAIDLKCDLWNPAGQHGGLFHPGRHQRLVEIILVDVDPARVLARAAGWNGPKRRAAKEGYLDVAGEDMERQEPALALEAIKWRVPLHGLAHVGHVPHNERVEPAPDVVLPARHPDDVRLHRGVAVRLRDLRVDARENDGDLLAFSHLDRLGLRACLRWGLGLGGRLAWLARARCAAGAGVR